MLVVRQVAWCTLLLDTVVPAVDTLRAVGKPVGTDKMVAGRMPAAGTVGAGRPVEATCKPVLGLPPTGTRPVSADCGRSVGVFPLRIYLPNSTVVELCTGRSRPGTLAPTLPYRQ